MKTPRRLHNLFVIFWFGLLLTLAAVVMAQVGRKSVPQPLIVTNGPGRGSIEQPNEVAADWDFEFSILSSASGPTNLHLQAQFVTVATGPGGLVFLSNALSAPPTNYFSVPQGSGKFDGDELIALTTNGDYWKTITSQLKLSEFNTNNRGSSLLLYLGSAQRSTNNYQVAYVYSIQGSTNVTNYYSTPVSTPRLDRVVPGKKYTFNIKAPDGAPTNMPLQAYLATIATNISTNGVTNFFLTNHPIVTANLDSAYFETNSGFFAGTNAVQLIPRGYARVDFKLKESAFLDNEIEDCLLVFLGTATNSSVKCDTAYIYAVDSPFMLQSKGAATNK